jgi:hypothetical protein
MFEGDTSAVSGADILEEKRVHTLTRDGYLLFATRIARLFAYGFLSVVLVLYLNQAGFSTPQIGLLLTLTLIGDTLLSLWITTQADRIGRKRMLLVGAGLMLLAGMVFARANYIFRCWRHHRRDRPSGNRGSVPGDRAGIPGADRHR